MVFVVKERTKELGIRKALRLRQNRWFKWFYKNRYLHYTGFVAARKVVILNNIGETLEDYFIKNLVHRYETACFQP